MSEAIAGVPSFTHVVVTPRPSAAVVLHRSSPSGLQVFWMQRAKQLRFAGGFYAFPGGSEDPGDADIAGAESSAIGAAARELFEETGVLITDQPPSAPNAGEAFGPWLARLGARVRSQAFAPAGRWVTPAHAPVRFDTQFFLVQLPDGQDAQLRGAEGVFSEWVRPQDALDRWTSGAVLLHPPQTHILSVLATTPLEQVLAPLQNPPGLVEGIAQRVEFQSGVQLVPLRTPTLPPATHTNCYLLGRGELLIVDPGSPDLREQQLLFAALDARIAEGCTLKAIVLTHHHFDHTGAVEALQRRFEVPVWAHPHTAARLRCPVARGLTEGTVIELEGTTPMRWRALHTPGHATGHLCLLDETSKAAVVGDMVAGVGTIVIDPPEGDMAEYLRQLTRLKPLVRTLYPAHGPPIADGVAKLDEYLAHRAWREQKVLAALGRGAAQLPTLVERAYDDVESFVWPIASRNTEAILHKLLVEGRARICADGYEATGQ